MLFAGVFLIWCSKSAFLVIRDSEFRVIFSENCSQKSIFSVKVLSVLVSHLNDAFRKDVLRQNNCQPRGSVADMGESYKTA